MDNVNTSIYYDINPNNDDDNNSESTTTNNNAKVQVGNRSFSGKTDHSINR